MRAPRWKVTLFAAFAALLAVVWLVLPVLRRANPTFIAHADPALAAVAGTVVDPDGHPVAGIEVTWFAADPDGVAMLGHRAFVGGREHVVTDARGGFRFAAVPTVDGHVAIAGSKPHWEGSTRELTPRAGFVASGLRLVARPIPPSRRLQGTLHDPDGKPLAFVPILAKGSRWLRNAQDLAVTDAHGRFEFVWPWDGEFELIARPEGAAEQPLGRVTSGEVHLTASLRR